MRVISGKYKGKRVLPPKKFPSRPTTDMAKEALFNILENRFHWEGLKVMDLFAGTGNISVEFLSRGVGQVISVDSHHIAISHMNKVRSEFEADNWVVIRKDVLKYMEHANGPFDIIFADPPFNMKETGTLPDLILNSGSLLEDGLLILEHGQENDFSGHPSLQDTRSYGGVYFSFFNKSKG